MGVKSSSKSTLTYSNDGDVEARFAEGFRVQSAILKHEKVWLGFGLSPFSKVTCSGTMLEKQSQAADKERHLVILCVDDEKPALFLRSAVLTSAGYKVLTASSSGEALQVFRENDVDLVITDHLLVGATGTALAKQIKELRPQVPIVILSGVVDEPEGMAAANLFLSKNAGPTEMLAQVARLLNL